jgi:hypothetical protein
MEWLILAVLGGVVSKLVSMGVDRVFDRRHKLQYPMLTTLRMRRVHRIRFWIAVAFCALYVWLGFGPLMLAIETGDVWSLAPALVMWLIAWFFGRFAWRHWQGWHGTDAG